MDISEHNLKNAQSKTNDPRVEFLLQDVTKRWQFENNEAEVIYSNMMFNEIEDISTPFNEAFRVLNPGGILAFSVTHPAWDLYIFARASAGEKATKIRNLGNYFRRGYAEFMMNADPTSVTTNHEKYPEPFVVEHFQRPVSDYFNALTDAGFVVEKMLEPPVTEELLTHAPGMAGYADHPVGLIFYCRKPSSMNL